MSSEEIEAAARDCDAVNGIPPAAAEEESGSELEEQPALSIEEDTSSPRAAL